MSFFLPSSLPPHRPFICDELSQRQEAARQGALEATDAAALRLAASDVQLKANAELAEWKTAFRADMA